MPVFFLLFNAPLSHFTNMLNLIVRIPPESSLLSESLLAITQRAGET